MIHRIVEKWKRLAIASALAVTGVLATSGCSFDEATGESVSRTQTSKEEPMSVSRQRPTILHVTQADFDKQVLRSEVPVLVDFYADWCGPCQQLGPVLEELAAETSDVKVVKVNVEHSPELAAEYGVESIPNLKVFKNGRVADQAVGLASKARLRAMLAR